MLTSTVRSASLASIIRTGMSASYALELRRLPACSSSVWPGKLTPASDSASLCNGAVTSAATSPHKAARAAHTTHCAAASPPSLVIWPNGTSSAGMSDSWKTGMQRGSASIASATLWICATGEWRVICATHIARPGAWSPHRRRRSSRATSGASRNALAMISGPIPAGSAGDDQGLGRFFNDSTDMEGFARGGYAGLSISTNTCSRPNCAATCAAAAGAP